MSKKNEFLSVELDKDLDPPSGGIGEFTLAPSGVYSLELQGEVICEFGKYFFYQSTDTKFKRNYIVKFYSGNPSEEIQ